MNNNINNNNNGIIGYNSQTGQPIYANNNLNNQQFNNNQNNNLNNQQFNNNQNNILNEEKIKKYRKMLHTDSIVLLVLSIIAGIVGFIFGENNVDAGFDLWFRSTFYMICFIIMVANKKNIEKNIGIFAIIISILMIIISIFTHSLFDIAYLILGIFYLIHTITYLKSFKGYIQTTKIKEKSKYDKLKYISLISLIMCIIYPIISIFNGLCFNIEFFYSKINFVLSILIFSLTSLILNIILLVKKRGSALVYVCTVFSTILVLIFGLDGIFMIGSSSKRKKLHESEEYYIEIAKDLEYTFEMDSKYYYNHAFYINNFDKNVFVISREKAEKEFESTRFDYYKEELGTCDGYVIINVDTKKIYDSYEHYRVRYGYSADQFSLQDYAKFGYTEIDDSLTQKAYINCKGKYNYQTDGFDSSKLN